MSSASINLVTGINGSGKTLWLLKHVEKMRQAENRPVYYFAIPGIKEQGVLTEWQEIQPYDRKDEKHDRLKNPDALWDLPQGSIIVIDEAHKTFPLRKQGSPVPNFIERLAEARHDGFTFFFVTQDQQDLDLFLRRRIGKHVHLFRAFGLERATVSEWEKCANPNNKDDQKKAITSEFQYPKEVYNWYKSSDSHQIKKAIPWKKLAIVIWGPLLITVLGYLVWHRLHTGTPETANQSTQGKDTPATQSKPETPADQAKTWAARFNERIKGLPMSEPHYDALFDKAASVPKISGCMEIQTDKFYRCTCNTQQGTTITSIDERMCRFYIGNGWFDPTKPDADNQPSLQQPPQPQIAQATQAAQ